MSNNAVAQTGGVGLSTEGLIGGFPDAQKLPRSTWLLLSFGHSIVLHRIQGRLREGA